VTREAPGTWEGGPAGQRYSTKHHKTTDHYLRTAWGIAWALQGILSGQYKRYCLLSE
jgi:hypothetical protein